MPYITDNEWTRYDIVEDPSVLYMNTTEWAKHISFPPTWYILKKSTDQEQPKVCNHDFDTTLIAATSVAICKKCWFSKWNIKQTKDCVKKDFWEELMEFMEYWIPLNDRDNKRMIKFLSSNWYL